MSACADIHASAQVDAQPKAHEARFQSQSLIA